MEQIESTQDDDIIESCDERTNRIMNEAFRIAYESNPTRIGWELHEVDCDFQITVEADKRPDAYYMMECYCDEDQQSEIIGITESVPAFISTYLSGRCSLHASLHVYTPERLEKILDEAEQVVIKFRKLREDFRIKQISN